MYLLFLRTGESGDDKQLIMGQIVRKNGSKKDFTVAPKTVTKIEFEYGDKVICLRGTFMMVINCGKKNPMVEAVTMYDRYWMPYYEVVLSEAFMEKHKLEQPVLPLTGVNHRVISGMVTR